MRQGRGTVVGVEGAGSYGAKIAQTLRREC